MRRRLISVAAIGFVLAATTAAQADYTLTILHINDLHSRLEPINKYDSTCNAEDDAAGKCFGGIARVKTKIDERRAAIGAGGGNVLALDAGDQFQGSLFYTTYKGAAAAEFMNLIGFDAMTVGNHEFDDGPEALARFLDKARFPVLLGNADVSSSDVLRGRLAGHVVLEVGGQQIGIIGVVAEDTGELSSSGSDVVFRRVEDVIRSAVAELERRGVNKIIALTHTGLPRDREIAAAVAGVDVIVGGHSHTLLSNTVDRAADGYPVWVTNPDGVDVPIVQAGAYSKYLGEIEIVFDDAGRVVSAKGEPHLLDASVSPDPTVAARLAELAAPIEELKSRVVAETSAAIDGDRGSCRSGECEMGNLVAEAMLDRVKGQDIQIAVQNGGGLRASIDAGPVTMGEVLTVLPFQNTVATFRLKGADVVAALESGVSQVEDGKGRFPQVAGLKFTWSRAVAPKGGRVKSVEVMDGGAWAPIEPDKVYGVVTNNFMRGGGDGYKVFATNAMDAYDYGSGLETVVADYLAAAGSYKPFVDGRIRELR